MSGILSSRFSAEDFAPRERLSVWREAYGRAVAKLELQPVSEGPFRAKATLRAFDGLGLVTMATRTLKFEKTRSLIDSDDLVLVCVETGGWVGSQLGRETQLGPGEATICWNADVAQGTTWGSRFMVRVPTQAIRPMVGDFSAGVLQRVPADNEALRLLRAYMVGLQQSDTTRELQRVATGHAYDLFGLILGTSRERAELSRGRGVRAARLKTIKDFICAQIANPALDAHGVAHQHRLSVRYLHRLFEEDGLTFSQFVLGVRLARAHRMLTDLRFSNRSISDIGYDVGFGDLSYFYRCFKREYGRTPSQARGDAATGTSEGNPSRFAPETI
ncbi:AraC family transcriptional regulator [Bradyrhizobium guangdongense]|uniref:AraC family transcriptional regulator n=1 Tax=Bradyrhizobium guangdongense TaxID=1325090 RepID=UPI00112B723B|nr:AraC family transcriptional regulator [Bradyrhizobium guangdongense]TPQ43062.1 AraC family transcriptional regulator [Bradyrhizobium guangdongense]